MDGTDAESQKFSPECLLNKGQIRLMRSWGLKRLRGETEQRQSWIFPLSHLVRLLTYRTVYHLI